MSNADAHEVKDSRPNRRGKRAVILVSAAIALLALSFIVGREVFRPPMPNSWAGVKSGMARDEVLRVVEGNHLDMRELKGFDVFTHETQMLGSRCYWQLMVTYDRTQNLMHADARFVHRGSDFLSSKRPKTVL